MKFAALFLAVLTLPGMVQAKDDFNLGNIPDFVPIPASRNTIKELRDGGFVLFMRHGKTDISHPDRLPQIDPADCTTQRNLSAAGKRELYWIGHYIRKARIPVGDIHASPLCRTRETAELTFGTEYAINPKLMFTSAMTDREKQQATEATRELVSRAVEGKTNRVIVAHAQNLAELMSYMPQPEGVVVIFKPMGNKLFKYIASVAPEQWRALQPVPKPIAQE